MKKIFTLITALLLSGVAFSQTALVNQTVMITHLAQGCSAIDASALQSGTLGLQNFGSNMNKNIGTGFWIAEKIIVPSTGWVTDSLINYTYQTNSGTSSPITGVYCYIAMDSSNSAPSSTIVAGSKTTNAMVGTTFSNIYRATETNISDCARPIMKTKSTLQSTLTVGTYWVVWSLTGSSSISGPWQPFVTKMGMAVTGAAMQTTSASVVAFNPITDVGFAQGAPFKLYGQGVTTTGIVEEVNFINSVAVSPNPVSTNATVKIDLAQNSSIMLKDISFVVYDALGREVLNYNNINSTSFDIERGSLGSGVYLYKVINKTSGNSINTGKLIFQ